MTKSKNKELTFEEMEVQLFYAYQQNKHKYYCSLQLCGDEILKIFSLYTQNEKTVNKYYEYIVNTRSYSENKKYFESMIKVLNGEEPDCNKW
ncbi:hypothetical protein [Anaerorhabdus sp.]|uniref:hypothetical protein n=1 Tax=Anaerorhabdus sp. TaxID=1872524 RepID=UPI002FC59705